MPTQNYLVIINDVRRSDGVTSSEEILDFLISRNVWVFPAHAPHVRRLEPGDKLIIYLAGESVFAAKTLVASKPAPLEGKLLHEAEHLGLSWFDSFIKIEGTELFEPPRSIRKLVNRLKFITNKEYFGLSLRLSPRKLDEKDLRVILETR